MLSQYPLSIPATHLSSFPALPSFYTLGDSYSTGIGANCGWVKDDLDPTRECLRCTGAFPYQIISLAGIDNMNVSHIACTGSRIADIKHPNPNNRSAQLEYMKSSNVTGGWGTLTIGGNDMGFAAIVENCIAYNVATCDQNMNFTEDIIANPKTVKTLAKTYLSVLEAAPTPDFTLIVPGYVQFFNAATQECDTQFIWFGRYLTRELRARINKMVDGMNLIIQIAVAIVQLHLVFKNSSKAIYYEDWDVLFDGHRFCEGRKTTWADAWFFTVQGVDILPNGTTVFDHHHPSIGKESSDFIDGKCGFVSKPSLEEQIACHKAVQRTFNPEDNLHTEGYPWYVMRIMHPKSIAHYALGKKMFEKWRDGEYFMGTGMSDLLSGEILSTVFGMEEVAD